MTEKTGKLSVLRGAFLIMNTMFGAGVICIPNGYMAMGYIGGSALLLLAVLITILTLIFLCMAVEKSQITNFADLSAKMGKKFGIFLDVLISLLCYGSTLCYFLMLVVNLSNMFYSTPGKKERAIVGLVIFIPLFFLSKMKSLDKLSFTSMLTVFSTFFVGVCLMIWNFTARTDLGRQANQFSFGIMKGYPALLFALGCQQNGVAVYAALKNRNQKNGIVTMVIGSCFAFVLYFLIGIFGYLTFGDIEQMKDANISSFFDIITKRESDFIKSLANTFDKKGIMAYALNIAFSCVLFAAFPLQTFSGRSALSNLFYKDGMSETTLWIVTFTHLLVVYLFGVFKLQVKIVLNLIGTTACPMISFFYPSLIYLHFFKKKGFMYFSACFIALLAVVAVILGMYTQTRDIIKTK